MNPLSALGGIGSAMGLDLGQIIGSILKDLLSQLMKQNDAAGLKTMQDLSAQQQQAPPQDTVASSPMPCSQSALPAANSSSSPSSSAGTGGNHVQVFGIVISQRDASVVPRSGGKLPEVDGSDAGWQKLADAAKSGLTGSPQAQDRILHGGKNPWDNSDGNRDERVAVLWSMQQNPNVRYDADKKEFFTQGADGSRSKVASLDEVEKTINDNGGYSTGNGTAMQAVGNLMNGRIDTSAKQSTTISMFGMQLDSAVDQLKQASSATGSTTDSDALTKKAKRIHEKLHSINDAVNAMQPMISFTQTSASVSA